MFSAGERGEKAGRGERERGRGEGRKRERVGRDVGREKEIILIECPRYRNLKN